MGEIQVVWRKKARQEYVRYLINAQVEYGSKTFFKWSDSIHEMEKVLADNPRQYGLVPQLRNKKHEFRGHIVMKHFKVIYAYDEPNRMVNIVTIWDMRMDPRKLIRSIR